MKTRTNEALPFQLRHMALTYLGMGITIPFAALAPYGIEPGIWAYTAFAAAAGMFGAWEQYRSRQGTLSSMGGNIWVTLLVLSIVLGCIGACFSILMGAAELAIRVALYSLVGMALAGLIGVRNGRLAMSADPEAWLQQRVDLKQQLLKHAPPPPVSTWQKLLIPLGIGGAAIVDALGVGRFSLLFLLLPLLLAIATFTTFKCGAEITQLWQLRKYERQHGLHFSRFPLAAIREQRRQLPLARWLCRPEALATPATPEAPAASTPPGKMRRRTKK